MTFVMNFIVHIVGNCLILHHHIKNNTRQLNSRSAVSKQYLKKHNWTSIKNKKGRRLDVCEIIRGLKVQVQTVGMIAYNLESFALYCIFKSYFFTWLHQGTLILADMFTTFQSVQEPLPWFACSRHFVWDLRHKSSRFHLSESPSLNGSEMSNTINSQIVTTGLYFQISPDPWLMQTPLQQFYFAFFPQMMLKYHEQNSTLSPQFSP